MSTPRLTTYKFLVYGGDADNPTFHEVAAIGRDIQRVEQLFADRRWGVATDRPMTSTAATAYFAMVRLGFYKGTFDAFEQWYLSIEPGEEVAADPTSAGVAPA